MKTMVISGYENIEGNNIDVDLMNRIATRQLEWSQINKYHYWWFGDLYTKIADAPEYRRMNFRPDTRAGSKADIARLIHIKEALKEYDRVIWLDGDMWLFDNFKIHDQGRYPNTPVAVLERSIDKIGGKYSTAICNAIMSFTKQNEPFLDYMLLTCYLLSQTKEKLYWAEFGPRLLKHLDKTFKINDDMIGLAFVEKGTRKAVGTPEGAIEFLKCYDEIWSDKGVKTSCVNLSFSYNKNHIANFIDNLENARKLIDSGETQ